MQPVIHVINSASFPWSCMQSQKFPNSQTRATKSIFIGLNTAQYYSSSAMNQLEGSAWIIIEVYFLASNFLTAEFMQHDFVVTSDIPTMFVSSRKCK